MKSEQGITFSFFLFSKSEKKNSSCFFDSLDCRGGLERAQQRERERESVSSPKSSAMTTDAANGGDGGGSAPTTSSSTPSSALATPSEVTVHPLVLLSVVDHHTRVAKDTRKRVVGILLGEVGSGGRVDVTNSFAGE